VNILDRLPHQWIDVQGIEVPAHEGRTAQNERGLTGGHPNATNVAGLDRRETKTLIPGRLDVFQHNHRRDAQYGAARIFQLHDKTSASAMR
jgi:hypothetical protein